MLSNLLSLYIASSLNNGMPSDTAHLPVDNIETKIVRVASLDLTGLINSSPVPIKNSEYISPIIDAKGSIATDLNTGTILFEKNAHERMPIASITKLMTILLILEENELNDTAIVSYNAASTEGSTMFLHEGEEIAIENLIYGAIINSANDAAIALAEYNAGSADAFVEKMNLKAKELGLINTNFSNPVGLDSSNNYSSAYDVAKLGSEVYKYEFVRHAASLKELEVWSVNKNYSHKLTSTNELLDNEFYYVKGLKTGRTDGAGLCLITVAENESGNEIVTVVLNSPARFEESKILIDWVYRAFNW